jgi:hypothetical protein
MFRRPSFVRQISFFEEQIVAKGVLGWILGPPGTGKSATSFAFVSSLNRDEWTVVWVHLTRSGDASIIIFDGDDKFKFDCTEQEASILLEGMRHQISITKTFLIIDGYVQEETGHHLVLGQAMVWRSHDTLKRRLAVISSMSSRSKVNYADDKNKNLLELSVCSWTIQEYLAAIRNIEFLQSVLFSLDSIDAEEEPSPVETVEAKFLVAGGCVRYMFSMCTSDVKKSITDAIASLEFSPSANILSAGQRRDKAINRLFNQYENAVGKTVSTLVSKFAEIEIAILKGPEAVRELFRLIRKNASESTAGGLFEAIFFVRMKLFGVTLTRRDGTKFKMDAADFEDYDAKMKTIPYAGPEFWLWPVSDTQIGFDAVYIDKGAKFARFVQLARGESHSFNMKGCNFLLSKVQGCRIEVVEFCFVVRDKLLHRFKISGGKKTIGRGCLDDYKVAGKEKNWQSGSEEHDAVIMAMEDIV